MFLENFISKSNGMYILRCMKCGKVIKSMIESLVVVTGILAGFVVENDEVLCEKCSEERR